MYGTVIYFTMNVRLQEIILKVTAVNFICLNKELLSLSSGVSRISFRGGGGGFKIFLEKWGYLHGASRVC